MAVISSVWSSFGHTFLSTDTEGEESCLSCGGRWLLVPRSDDPDETSGDYQASNGDDPVSCPGAEAAPTHGDVPCQADNGRSCEDRGEGEPCSHESAECNCLFCTG